LGKGGTNLGLIRSEVRAKWGLYLIDESKLSDPSANATRPSELHSKPTPRLGHWPTELAMVLSVWMANIIRQTS